MYQESYPHSRPSSLLPMLSWDCPGLTCILLSLAQARPLGSWGLGWHRGICLACADRGFHAPAEPGGACWAEAQSWRLQRVPGGGDSTRTGSAWVPERGTSLPLSSLASSLSLAGGVCRSLSSRSPLRGCEWRDEHRGEGSRREEREIETDGKGERNSERKSVSLREKERERQRQEEGKWRGFRAGREKDRKGGG